MSVMLTILQKQQTDDEKMEVVSLGTISIQDAVYWFVYHFRSATMWGSKFKLEVLGNGPEMIEIKLNALVHIEGMIQTDLYDRSHGDSFVYQFKGSLDDLLQLDELMHLYAKDTREDMFSQVFSGFNDRFFRSPQAAPCDVQPPQPPPTGLRDRTAMKASSPRGRR